MDWTPIWHQAAAPAFAMGFLAGKKKTVVYSVISQVSGEKLRVRFSNHYGKKPYTIGGLTVWAQGEMHTVTRDGSCVFTVPAGESCYSDALTLPVTMGEELEIRLYYASKVMDSNMIEENAVSYQGNHTTDSELPPPRREKYMEQYGLYEAIPGMDQIEVFTGQPSKIIVAFGDSITAMNRWVKPLQRRLFDAYGGDYALMNAGIGGNCLLYDIPGLMGVSYGEKGVSRFERDVLRFSGLCGVILALGVNDVAYYSQKTGAVISLEQYGSAVTDIVDRLHKAGVRVIAQTLPPRSGFVKKGYTPEMEALRVSINEWIRDSALFDYMVDADALLRDPKNPSFTDERYHQGDHLHPNQAGGMLMAQAYDLQKLTGEA